MASHYYTFFYVSSFVLGAKSAARKINIVPALVKHPQILGFKVFETLPMLLMYFLKNYKTKQFMTDPLGNISPSSPKQSQNFHG